MSDSDSDSEEAAPVLNQKAAVEASTAPEAHRVANDLATVVRARFS